MKKGIFILFSFSLFHLSYAQNNWLWSVNGNGNGLIQSVATDYKGNCFAAGMLDKDSIHFGVYNLTDTDFDYDFFLMKIDPNGNVLWAKQTNSIAYSIYAENDDAVAVSTDGSGNSFLMANFPDTMIIGIDTLINYMGLQNNFLVKFDPNGNIRWCKKSICPNDSSLAAGTNVSTDFSGNTFVTGNFADSAQFGSQKISTPESNTILTFLVKYDSNGNVKWVEQSTGKRNDGASVWGIANDRLGNTYITGYFIDTIKFGAHSLYKANSENVTVFLTKYDSNGNVLWAKQSFNSITCESSGWKVVTDSSENIYLTGGFTDTISFGSDTLIAPYEQQSIFFIKYDPNGNVVWAKQTDVLDKNDWAPCAMSIDKYNHIFFSGDGGDSGDSIYKIKFGDSTLQITDTAKLDHPTFIIKLDTGANVLCGTFIPGGNFSGFSGLASDSTGNYVYYGGSAATQLIFGNDTVNPFSIPVNRNKWEVNVFPFVARWDECDKTVGVNEVKSESEKVKVFPNPTTGETELQITNYELGMKYRVEVFNVFGQEVFSAPFQLPPASSTCQINLSAQPEGVYFYRVINEEVASPSLAMMVVGQGKIIIER